MTADGYPYVRDRRLKPITGRYGRRLHILIWELKHSRYLGKVLYVVREDGLEFPPLPESERIESDS